MASKKPPRAESPRRNADSDLQALVFAVELANERVDRLVGQLAGVASADEL